MINAVVISHTTASASRSSIDSISNEDHDNDEEDNE